MKNIMRISSANNPVTKEIQTIFIKNIGKPSYASYYKLIPCTAHKDKWDTKKDKHKSIVYKLQCAKRHLLGDKTFNKPVALVVIELHLSEGIRQLVSQQKIHFFLNCCNLLEVFQVVLKEHLGLVIPNQYQFLANNFCGKL